MDFDSVTFEDLFQFSPDSAHRGEEEGGGNSRDYYIPSPQQQQHHQQHQHHLQQQDQSSAVEAEYNELQQHNQQLTQLQNSAPYINYPQQQSQQSSNNWIEVPKTGGGHVRSGSSADEASTTGGLCVGSEGGSTLCVGSSGSTASLDDHMANTSLPGGLDGDRQQPGRRRRGRGPPDETYKLERSRQSARECRARKKLRYQYLDDVILERERTNMLLRKELEKYVSWCTELDKGRLPDGWNDFINSSEIKQEIKKEY